MNSQDLTEKIINYLCNLEKNSSLALSDRKKNTLLQFNRQEYEKLDQTQKEYQELLQEVSKTEQKSLKEEIRTLTEQKKKLISEIKEQIITEAKTGPNALIEIRPGPGGDEAGLFVRDLYKMYESFAEKKKWKVEILEKKVGPIGNFNFISFLVKGKSAFNYLRNEAGVHRVQRFPETGRGQKETSTATVVVLSETPDIALKIDPKDLKIETYGSGGPGGQHANKTESAVRITYMYDKNTKIVATSQDGRDQRTNRERAMIVLKTRLLERMKTEAEKKVGNLRSTMIGTAERSEKIRTYNFYANEVRDHRLKMSWGGSDSILAGELEEICQKLIDYEVEKKISS